MRELSQIDGPLREEDFYSARSARFEHGENPIQYRASKYVAADTSVPRWCHASCCSGETRIDTTEFTSHEAQWLLDQLGYPSGSLGWDEFTHSIFAKIIRDRAITEQTRQKVRLAFAGSRVRK